MAFRDYILCGQCETKIVYDGDDNGRDRLEKIWGDPNAEVWTVHLLCPDCIKKLQADLAAARTELVELLKLLDSAQYFVPSGLLRDRIDDALTPADQPPSTTQQFGMDLWSGCKP